MRRFAEWQSWARSDLPCSFTTSTAMPLVRHAAYLYCAEAALFLEVSGRVHRLHYCHSGRKSSRPTGVGVSTIARVMSAAQMGARCCMQAGPQHDRKSVPVRTDAWTHAQAAVAKASTGCSQESSIELPFIVMEPGHWRHAWREEHEQEGLLLAKEARDVHAICNSACRWRCFSVGER